MQLSYIHYRREKLVNAIAYFLNNTRYCYTLKLFKLLYFLDFEHYRQAGRSVTGLAYRALPKGPVPADLYDEIKNYTKKVEGENVPLGVREAADDIGELDRREFMPQDEYDSTYFTPRELTIMKRLATIFGEDTADAMIAHSHDPKLPWQKVYKTGEGKGDAISYDLALESTPIVEQVPTIDKDELIILKDVFRGTGLQ